MEEENFKRETDGELLKPFDSTKPLLLLVEDNKEILNIKQELTDKYNEPIKFSLLFSIFEKILMTHSK
jgi:hypothetical protein